MLMITEGAHGQRQKSTTPRERVEELVDDVVDEHGAGGFVMVLARATEAFIARWPEAAIVCKPKAIREGLRPFVAAAMSGAPIGAVPTPPKASPPAATAQLRKADSSPVVADEDEDEGEVAEAPVNMDKGAAHLANAAQRIARRIDTFRLPDGRVFGQLLWSELPAVERRYTQVAILARRVREHGIPADPNVPISEVISADTMDELFAAAEREANANA